MKISKAIAIFAAFVAALSFTLWANGGFHSGWSQTQIPEERVDEITGIEYVEYTEGFVPGLDFMVSAGLLVTCLLIIAGLLARRQSTKTLPTQKS